MKTRNIFIVVLSPDAVASNWVNDEIDIAWRRRNDPDPAKRMLIIPVLYRPCEIRLSLESLQVVSFLPPKAYNAAFQEVLIALGLPSKTSKLKTLIARWTNQTTVRVERGATSSPPGSFPTRPEAFVALRTLQGHTASVNSVAFSPYLNSLASGSYDNTIKLWNVQTGQVLRTLEGPEGHGVLSVVFSPDGHSLASGSYDDTIVIWGVKG